MKTRNTIALTLLAAGLCTFNVFATESTTTDPDRIDDRPAETTTTVEADKFEIEERREEPQFHDADITQDNLVNIDDLLAVLEAWGTYPRGRFHPADIAPADGDYEVGYDDMLFVIANWGATN